jgi:hypothetical protein
MTYDQSRDVRPELGCATEVGAYERSCDVQPESGRQLESGYTSGVVMSIGVGMYDLSRDVRPE